MWENARKLIEMIAEGHHNSLVLISDYGLGKSYLILNTFKELGLEEGKDFIYLTSYSTPKELFNIMSDYRDKIIILDDMDNIVRDRNTLAILKSALWSVTNKRTVAWYSSRENVNRQFEFSGSIVLCLNNIPDNEIVHGLLSRSFVYQIHPNLQERKDFIKKVFNHPCIDWFLNLDILEREFNLKNAVKLIKIYEFDKDNWQTIATSWLNPRDNKNLLILKNIQCMNLGIEDKIKTFKEKTNLSRASYYRLTKQLV